VGDRGMRLAIIPARGGSKRIPRKNVRAFRGKPIIAWSIDVARRSGLFDIVMVSTDDDEISQVARDAGAETPFQRTAEASSDVASTAAVLEEVLASYEAAGQAFDTACCLYATAPLAVAEDLERGYRLLVDGPHDVVLPVTAFDYPIWRSLARDPDGSLKPNFPEHIPARSQDLPTAYHDAGQWYWFKTAPFRAHRALLGPQSGSVIIPSSRVQDIDTEEDWALAEMKHTRLYALAH
jgi:pseudaminic acid cytidylyltransferase